MADSAAYQPNQPTQFESSGNNHGPYMPPASIDYSSGVETLIIPSKCTPIQRTGSQYGNAQFLAALTKSSTLSFEHGMTRWQYGNRSTAQDILPYLLLGPINFARDPELIRKAGITMMIAVRSKITAEKIPNIMNPLRFPSTQGIVTATFDIDTAFDALRGRSEIIKAMNDHIEASCEGKTISHLEDIPGKILVFCETGNERAPLLVAMYLMVVWGLDGISAYQAIQARRFGVGMGTEIMTMLETFTQICEAERSVVKTQNEENGDIASSTATKKSKRNIEATYDDDDYSIEEMDSTQLHHDEHRAGVAPFAEYSFPPMRY